MVKRDDYVMGLWKFDMSRVSEDKLSELAEEWAKDDKYVHLYIRQASKDQYGLGFTYVKEDGTKESYDRYFKETQDILYKRFGNALVGWDIASGGVLVKGFDL